MLTPDFCEPHGCFIGGGPILKGIHHFLGVYPLIITIGVYESGVDIT